MYVQETILLEETCNWEGKKLLNHEENARAMTFFMGFGMYNRSGKRVTVYGT